MSSGQENQSDTDDCRYKSAHEDTAYERSGSVLIGRGGFSGLEWANWSRGRRRSLNLPVANLCHKGNGNCCGDSGDLDLPIRNLGDQGCGSDGGHGAGAGGCVALDLPCRRVSEEFSEQSRSWVTEEEKTDLPSSIWQIGITLSVVITCG